MTILHYIAVAYVVGLWITAASVIVVYRNRPEKLNLVKMGCWIALWPALWLAFLALLIADFILRALGGRGIDFN